VQINVVRLIYIVDQNRHLIRWHRLYNLKVQAVIPYGSLLMGAGFQLDRELRFDGWNISFDTGRKCDYAANSHKAPQQLQYQSSVEQ
jgi:hypothetical protein